jgi:putative nucleotidyltransferase with HDIG domain
MEQADRFIDRVPHLAPVPTIATELLELFNEPDRDLDRIVQLISHDPSLTAEVLRRCNSAYFAGAQPASDMFEAVARLGFYEVYCVVVSLVGSRTLALARPEGGLDIARLWRHSVATAVAAAVLARHAGEPDAVAFTAGLLHDVGKLILCAVEPACYAKLLRESGGCGAMLVEAEQEVLHANHAVVGARLLARWGLPANVAVTVLEHHRPHTSAKPFERQCAAVYLANEMAHRMIEGEGTVPESGPASSGPMGVLKLQPEDLPLLRQQMEADLARVQGLFQISA